MSRAYWLALTLAVTLACCTGQALGGSATQWYDTLDADEAYHSAVHFGAWPGNADGYDGQTPQTIDASEVHMLLYRENGASWTGPSGFYAQDFESPIPDGGSKTWWDIRLWSYNYTPRLGDQVAVGCTWGGSGTKPPAGYTGILTLDYVPVSLNWTGPTEFRFDLTKTMGYYLPCPITDDPFNPENVTRMHLTVYTTPEPSSLAALGLALAGLGAGAVRRRRR